MAIRADFGVEPLYFSGDQVTLEFTLEHDALTVTVDAQLVLAALKAIPYLVSYPYECTEQTLNRFLSTGILTSLFDRIPGLSRLAEVYAERRTQFEPWEPDDPNRRMLLEESPWLRVAEGGDRSEEELIRVLDPDVARAQREGSLAELVEGQLGLGGLDVERGGCVRPVGLCHLAELPGTLPVPVGHGVCDLLVYAHVGLLGW